MKNEGSQFKRIRIVESSFEVHQIESILKEADISYKVISYRDTAFADLYRRERGWGEIQVQEQQATRAREIIEQKLPELSNIPEKEAEDQALSSRLTEEDKKPWLSDFEWVVTVILLAYGVALIYLLCDNWSLEPWVWKLVVASFVCVILVWKLFFSRGKSR